MIDDAREHRGYDGERESNKDEAAGKGGDVK